jgi:glycosyltransferase involved in cell wall biosynthesis
MGLSDRVIFTGRVHYHEAFRYLRMGDVAVAPKVSATEGSGKLPNYMSMALPTVAFDIEVSREYLGEWGCYASVGDHLSLAQEIASILEDRERAALLGTRLRERAIRRYSGSVLRQKLASVYSAVLDREA